MAELLCKEEVYTLVGVAMDVHRELGSGFLEVVYQEAMAIELAAQGVPFEARKPLPIYYKGRQIEKE